MSRSKNSLARWWGFALVVAVLAALPSREVPAAILFVLSGLGLVWVLLLLPFGAEQRLGGTNPAETTLGGYLLGCHLREHRSQKFKMMFVSRRWQQLNRGLWSGPAEILATVSGVVTIVGVVVAIVRWIAVATSVA
jgi:hypothetical protein